jgi:uncharacterized protein (TIGR02271 family)
MSKETVVTEDGVYGTIEPGRHPGDNNQVSVIFNNNQQVVVPADMLISKGRGSYYLPIRLAELKHQTSSDVNLEDTPIVIPVLEEDLYVDKQTVETGRIRLQKRVHATEETIDLPLLEETVQVERMPINRYVETPAPIRYEGNTMIVPLHQEVIVVQKQLMLKEEVHIWKERAEVHRPEKVTLRSEEVEVERVHGQERQTVSDINNKK